MMRCVACMIIFSPIILYPANQLTPAQQAIINKEKAELSLLQKAQQKIQTTPSAPTAAENDINMVTQVTGGILTQSGIPFVPSFGVWGAVGGAIEDSQPLISDIGSHASAGTIAKDIGKMAWNGSQYVPVVSTAYDAKQTFDDLKSGSTLKNVTGAVDAALLPFNVVGIPITGDQIVNGVTSAVSGAESTGKIIGKGAEVAGKAIASSAKTTGQTIASGVKTAAQDVGSFFKNLF